MCNLPIKYIIAKYLLTRFRKCSGENCYTKNQVKRAVTLNQSKCHFCLNVPYIPSKDTTQTLFNKLYDRNEHCLNALRVWMRAHGDNYVTDVNIFSPEAAVSVLWVDKQH